MLDDLRLLRDSEISRLTSMSQSWVRKQRMYRRRGLDHVLKIDPVMIGPCPRYRISDVDAWLASQSTQAK
jgi:predicted DNA-binding transcriptional regulator AlpA